MKHILLIATGGTIASAEDGNGLSPALTGEELARNVPEIEGLCELDIVQPMNIDSTNMRPADWLRIAEVIRENYDTHDGFVVLHGTDTMSYTAAALSYLIQDSPKPIVLTGSQQPMGNPFTDAKINLYQSLVYAVSDRSRDVSIVFGGYAIAGTRARKQRTMSFNAFNSINYPVLAYLRQDKIICSGSAAVSAGPAECDCAGDGAARDADGALDEPRFYNELNSRVCALKLTPGLTPDIFRLLKPDYDAVILETFGMGGVPERGADGASYQEAIFDWVDSGRTVVMTTQVPEEGLDLGVYEVGRAYAEHPGILKGGDMTTEALVAKTMWALGQTRDADELQRLFYRPINHDRVDEW
ncbi:L-asparaginase, type I [Collinsella intestinalis DSM 13280]|uniref:asparaginase n=1 Tax=Collinsella intestinalis DSM 13280 TaxID=521003 RepID=C4FA92_9ACTN|nr:asparaginase [Collinsella intestinalis]EEP44261.1 L-asparaginase, type I [Collinsella intestinalis DSM 13280]